MKWFTDFVKPKLRRLIGRAEQGLAHVNVNWTTCTQCRAVSYIQEVVENLYTCKSCNYHDYISNNDRIHSLLTNYVSIEVQYNIDDPLEFHDTITYKERLASARTKSGQHDATTLVSGFIDSRKVIMLCMDFKFMGGSMGINVGNAFVQGVEESIAHKAPYIVFTSSGGARMQEGIYSLMQMPRTVAAVNKLKQHSIPYIVVWTYPTMGGVAASFAALGDITLAEHGALIGFTGRRVIENTIKVQLPEDFQTSDFQLKQGMIDQVVHRKHLRTTLSKILRII